jgi:ferredoxin
MAIDERLQHAPGSALDQRPRRSGRVPVIDPQRCTGCGRCVAVCAPRLLSLEVVRWEKLSVLHDPQRCTGCNQCAVNCPFHAITLQAPPSVPPQNPGSPNVAEPP